MLKQILKFIYLIVLIGLAVDSFVYVRYSYHVEQKVVFNQVLVSVLSCTFPLAYLLYFVEKSKNAIYYAASTFFLLAAWIVGKTYISPILNQDEYLFAIAFYLILGLPMFIGSYKQLKHNKLFMKGTS